MFHASTIVAQGSEGMAIYASTGDRVAFISTALPKACSAQWFNSKALQGTLSWIIVVQPSSCNCSCDGLCVGFTILFSRIFNTHFTRINLLMTSINLLFLFFFFSFLQGNVTCAFGTSPWFPRVPLRLLLVILWCDSSNMRATSKSDIISFPKIDASPRSLHTESEGSIETTQQNGEYWNIDLHFYFSYSIVFF